MLALKYSVTTSRNFDALLADWVVFGSVCFASKPNAYYHYLVVAIVAEPSIAKVWGLNEFLMKRQIDFLL